MSEITGCDHSVYYIVHNEEEGTEFCAICALEVGELQIEQLQKQLSFTAKQLDETQAMRDAAVIDHHNIQNGLRIALKTVYMLAKQYDLHPVLSTIADISKKALEPKP